MPQLTWRSSADQ